MSLLSSIRKGRWMDWINPRKWGIFVRYIRMRILRKEYEELRTPEYLDQIVIRMSEPGCRGCIKAGECNHCGCKSPELFYDKNNWCSGEHWNEMIAAESWKEYKEESDIEIDEDYLDQVKKFGTIRKFK